MLRKSILKKLRIIGLLVLVFLFQRAGAQESKQMVRLAIITIDSIQLNAYTKALNEQMNAAIKLEPGVLTYYAVAEKSAPNRITILEIYADTAAYQSHIKTVHFLKYKDLVKDMVTSLNLVDVTLIGMARKPA